MADSARGPVQYDAKLPIHLIGHERHQGGEAAKEIEAGEDDEDQAEHPHHAKGTKRKASS